MYEENWLAFFKKQSIPWEDRSLRILSGRTHIPLAKKLARYTNIPYVHAITEIYPDQELHIRLTEPLYAQEVVIVQSTSPPAHDHLMELMLLADAAKRAGATRITAVIPYFGYSRQDRPTQDNTGYSPIPARLAATLLEAAGIQHVITLDLHCKPLIGFFNICVEDLDPTPLFSAAFNTTHKTHTIHTTVPRIVVSPDRGGMRRARRFSEQLDLDLTLIDKHRDQARTCHLNEIIGNVAEKHCILFDDIVDTAETVCKAAALLIREGALSVEACITHAVLSGAAIERIQASPIQQIAITDSIRHTQLPSKFRVISIECLLSEALKRLHGNR